MRRHAADVMKALIPATVALVFAGAACNKSNPTTTTTAPSTIVTETFTGTVAVGSSDSHTFNVAQAGEVDVTLTAAGPPATIVMGIAVGIPNGSACAPLAGASLNTQAGSSPQLPGRVTAGSLCVEVYDVGNETAPVAYTVTVTHP